MINDAVPVFSARLCIERHVLCQRNAALKRLQDVSVCFCLTRADLSV